MLKKIKLDQVIYFIEIIQILALILFWLLYKGIFLPGIFISLSLIIIIFTYRLFRNKNTRWFEIRVTIILLSSIVIFIMMFLSRPTYTFNDGKNLVFNHFSLDETYEYKAYKIWHNTIPSNYQEIYAFQANKVYYYRFYKNDEYRYFIVTPNSGVVMDIEGEYWTNID